jgi:HK97 family phage major capsid protein
MGKIDNIRRLAKYLELAYEPYNDRRRTIIEREIPRDLTHEHDGRVVNVRELLQTESIVGTTLVPAQVLATVIDGAEPVKCMRELVPLFDAKGKRSVVIPLGETGTYAAEVAEGAEAEDDEVTYTAATHTIKKYVSKPRITEEMIADGQWDVAAHETFKAGARLENVLNQQALSVLLEGSGDEFDASASDVGLKAMAKAYAEMMANGFKADAVVIHPTAMGYLLPELMPVGGYYQVSDTTVSGVLPSSILGMKAGVCGVADTSDTYTWGYGTDGYMGMLLLDSKSCGGIAMNQDVTLTEFDDPLKGLKSFKCMMRFGVATHHANAAERVEY